MKTKNTQKSLTRRMFTNNKNTYSSAGDLVKNYVLGIGLTNANENEVLEYVMEVLRKTHKKLSIVTPNPEIVMLARRMSMLKEAINNADLALCDGVGLLWGAKVMAKPIKERIIGTNFMESLCEKVNDWPITVGFLGGRPGVAEKVADCLLKKYPKLKVSFVGQEWNDIGFENANKFHAGNSPEKEATISRSVIEVSPSSKTSKSTMKEKFSSSKSNSVKKVDILFVAFGAPKQELWMHEHIDKLPVRVMMGVGGAFDQIIDSSLRPPDWVHSLGLGWLYRLIRQPWRLKRQLVLIQFVILVLEEKLYSLSSRTK